MSRRQHHGRRVRAEITIAAPPDEVWRAWADPERIAQWFVDRAEGVARPGEIMTWVFDAFSYRIPVPILEAEPGRTFVTGAEGGPLPILMEVDVETAGGGTRLRLVNSGFSEDPSRDDEVDGVRSGWEMALATLKHWLERAPQAPRTHAIAMRPVAASLDEIAARYAGAAGLSRWLDGVRAPERLTVGERVSAALGGHPLSGAVLATPGREVLLEWSELGGVLGLKAFVQGGQVVAALDLSVWGDPGQDARGALHAALDRLAGTLGDTTR